MLLLQDSCLAGIFVCIALRAPCRHARMAKLVYARDLKVLAGDISHRRDYQHLSNVLICKTLGRVRVRDVPVSGLSRSRVDGSSRGEQSKIDCAEVGTLRRRAPGEIQVAEQQDQANASQSDFQVKEAQGDGSLTLALYAVALLALIWSAYIALGTYRPISDLQLHAPPTPATPIGDVFAVGADLHALSGDLKDFQHVFSQQKNSTPNPEMADKLDTLVRQLDQVANRVRGLEQTVTNNPASDSSAKVLEANVRNLEVRLEDKFGEATRSIERVFNLSIGLLIALAALGLTQVLERRKEPPPPTRRRRQS